MQSIVESAMQEKKSVEFDFTTPTASGQPLRLHMKANHVTDANSKVEFICVLQEAGDGEK